MKKYIALLMGLFITIVSCDNGDVFDLESEQDIDPASLLIVNLSIDSTTVPIQIIVNIEIPEHINDPEKRRLVLTTDKGGFKGALNNDKSYEITLDDSGRTSEKINTMGETGDFTVIVALKSDSSFKNTQIITLPNSRSSYLQINLSSNSVKANGLDLVNIDVNINDALDINTSRVLSLSHNLPDGNFVNHSGVKMVEIPITSRAISVPLKVGLTPGDYTVSASIKDLGNSLNSNLKVEKLSADDVFSVLDVNPTDILADGKSELRLKLKVANTPKTKIMLMSNLGGFVPSGSSEVDVDDNGEAEIQFQVSNQVELHNITYQVTHNEAIISNHQFTPQRAQPDQIQLTSNTYNIDSSMLATQVIMLDISTSRTFGTVSNGTDIDLKAFQISDGIEKEVGLIKDVFNIKTDSTGKVSKIEFRPLPSTIVSIKDDIVLLASTVNQEGVIVSDEIRITIN